MKCWDQMLQWTIILKKMIASNEFNSNAKFIFSVWSNDRMFERILIIKYISYILFFVFSFEYLNCVEHACIQSYHITTYSFILHIYYIENSSRVIRLNKQWTTTLKWNRKHYNRKQRLILEFVMAFIYYIA